MSRFLTICAFLCRCEFHPTKIGHHYRVSWGFLFVCGLNAEKFGFLQRILPRWLCSSATVEISKNGEEYTLKTTTTAKNSELKFKLGEPFSEHTMGWSGCGGDYLRLIDWLIGSLMWLTITLIDWLIDWLIMWLEASRKYSEFSFFQCFLHFVLHSNFSDDIHAWRQRSEAGPAWRQGRLRFELGSGVCGWPACHGAFHFLFFAKKFFVWI